MAEMNDRGQLLLLAGIFLAVLFVALALLVNTAIYTDNVATRGGDSAGEALEYQSSVVDSVGGLIDAENADGDHGTRDEIRNAVKAGTETIDSIHTQNHRRRGVDTNISTGNISAETTTDGTLLRRTNPGEIQEWNVSNASGVRAFDIGLEAGSVGSDPLNITLDSTTLFVYKDAGDVVVAQDSMANVTCRANATGTVRFDVTDGRLGGDRCQIEWPDINGEVGFENNGSVNGTYNVTVAADVDPATFDPDIDAKRALYSIDELEIRIDTPQLRYETTVRIAPGEPDV
ncbi:MAG: hypothetical protein V5A36_07130 [Natronomonas sp.]